MSPNIRRTQLLLESEGGWPGELEAPYRLHRKRSGLLAAFPGSFPAFPVWLETQPDLKRS
jgi:hypothetical protein